MNAKWNEFNKVKLRLPKLSTWNRLTAHGLLHPLSTSLGGYHPPCPKKHLKISEVNSKPLSPLWTFGNSSGYTA